MGENLNQLRREYRQLKRHLPKLIGETCVCCGEKTDIQYHHILALHQGGDNRLSNIVPVCIRCHKAIHNDKESWKYKRGQNGGRPPEINTSIIGAYNSYIEGRIGNKKLGEIIAPNRKSKRVFNPNSRTSYKQYLESIGIKKVKNIIDIRETNSELRDGDIVGEIEYLDGTRKILYFIDTGENDTDYTKRSG